MIGAIIGAVTSIGSGIAGAVTGARKRRQQRKDLKEQKEIENAWYNRNYNADFTQRADAQRLITRTADAFKNRNKEIAGTQAVMGGTEESVAAQREQNNQALADVPSAIAANSEQYKTAIDQQHENNQLRFLQAKSNIAEQESQQNAQAVSGALKGIGTAAAALDTQSTQGSTTRTSAATPQKKAVSTYREPETPTVKTDAKGNRVSSMPTTDNVRSVSKDEYDILSGLSDIDIQRYGLTSPRVTNNLESSVGNGIRA